ncbi:hypothetical protein F4780DRAFT_793046 [Xylariomycetidae sp. FL0641]|nr:hypothetical protein F4780DRAFT_793046 [Xylariomycetidae sp. FL0641]
MAQSGDTAAAAPKPAMPDYMTDPNAVLGDKDAEWRYGRGPPDYSKTRAFFAETKSRNHEAGTLPQLVENLVKNWEIEASFKTRTADWRTVAGDDYTFAVNGQAPQDAAHMLKVGTYNALIAANPWYDAERSDFAASHKAFKRAMPTFAWECLEVYSGPPVVAFRWRHWGEMRGDYTGVNGKGENVTVKATGRPVDIEGVTVAHLNDEFKITKLETWFDSAAMFRQMDPEGLVLKGADVRVEVEDSPAGLSAC